MHHAMPPLNALRAFEAAARHGSMSKAAEELSVTPGALSHQVRGLEDYLDVKLFERLTRAIRLTPAGEALYPGLQLGFQQLHEAVSALRRSVDPNLLTISTPPGLTAKWLAPRLYRFAAEHSDIEIRVASSVRPTDFAADGVDLAIRNLPVDGDAGVGLASVFLHEIRVLPVCAPAIADEFGPFERPSDLAAAPLIEDETAVGAARLPRWADWFEVAGARAAAHGGGLRFNSPDHALDATVEGGGVLLAQDILAFDDLKSGRLIAPYELSLPTGRAFYLVFPQTVAEAPNVIAFKEWTLREIAQCVGAPEQAWRLSMTP